MTARPGARQVCHMLSGNSQMESRLLRQAYVVSLGSSQPVQSTRLRSLHWTPTPCDPLADGPEGQPRPCPPAKTLLATGRRGDLVSGTPLVFSHGPSPREAPRSEKCHLPAGSGDLTPAQAGPVGATAGGCEGGVIRRTGSGAPEAAPPRLDSASPA